MKLFKWHLIDDIELRCYENGLVREYKKRLEILEKEDFLKTKRLTERDFEIERLNNIIKEVREYIKEKTKWYDELLGIVEMHGYNTNRIPIVFVDELLEILDKGE